MSKLTGTVGRERAQIRARVRTGGKGHKGQQGPKGRGWGQDGDADGTASAKLVGREARTGDADGMGGEDFA